MPIITCPHCGARRNTPERRLPQKPTRARCPECRQTFNFAPAQQLAAGTSENQNIHVCCPHCKLPREIPRSRITNSRTTVSCRRCKESFRLDQQSPQNQPSSPQLSKVGHLFAASWELFCKRGWGLLGIYLGACLLLFVPLLYGIFNITKLAESRALFWTTIALAGLYLFVGSSWMTASLFNHICHRQLGFFAAIGRGRRQIWKFSGLLLLLGLVITGGSLLLIIPGLIFTVWFFFCNYILAEEGGGILKALEKSRQLVRGRWWAVFGRFSLLLLVVLAISTLTARLPVLGGPLNFGFSLLLTPFSLIYYYLIYQDLKNCQPSPDPTESHSAWLPLTIALLGWMLIPGLLFISYANKAFQSDDFSLVGNQLIPELLGPELPTELVNPTPQAENHYQWPKKLTLADYDRILGTAPQPSKQGLTLGPATLSAEHFWTDEENPHLWLKLEMNDAPNLALSHHRATRILIDKVLDNQLRNRYNHEHSFENSAFHWINLHSPDSEQSPYSGIRNVYLKEGTRPEEIRSISGMLEFNLPLKIKTLTIKSADVGRTITVAGKRLTIEALKNDGISLNFYGKLAELLSIRALNRDSEYLPEAGFTWQQQGEKINLKQMFSGDVDSVTILIASESVPRRYPFEITR